MGKEMAGKGGGKVIADERFAAVHYDPRFQRFPKAKAKLEVDERFKGMFDDPAFQLGSGMDKRGRKQQSKKKNEDMRRYYRLREEEEEMVKEAGEASEDEQAQEQAKGGKNKKKAHTAKAPATSAVSDEEHPGSVSDEESDSEDQDSEGAAARERWARMRGLAGPEESSTSEEDNSEEEPDSDASSPEASDTDREGAGALDAATAEWGVGALAANPREKIPMLPDATPRLACVDLDWENIRAVDIFVALRSFVPTGGVLQKVTVYPSDYGLERMAAEAKAGPQGIWQRPGGRKGGKQEEQQQRKRKQELEDDGSSEEESEEDSELDSADEGTSDEELGGSEESGGEEEDSGEDSGDDEAADGEVDPERLRLYERSKLRWYYAIVECDSAETANHLYDQCDGMELMKTANLFDLRFVPEEQSFSGRQVRDSATDVPPDYEPPVFQTKALQHTNVELTWDKGDASRRRTLTKRLTADELKEDDFKAYLATDSEPSDDEDDGPAGAGGGKADAEAIRERYRRLLLGGGQGAEAVVGKKDWGAGVEERDGDEREGGEGSEEGGEEGDEKMDMEVTFVPGLEGLGERLVAKRREAEARAGETVWDAYMRRKREKKAEAKRKGKVNVDSDDAASDSEDEAQGSDSDHDMPAGVADDPFFQHEADPFDDPFFKDGPGGVGLDGTGKPKSKKKEKRKGDERKQGGDDDLEADRRRRAELEMLLMDEGDLLKAGSRANAAGNSKTAAGDGAAGSKLSKKERMRLKKERARKDRQGESDDEDHDAAVGAGFKVNLDDPRFKDLYASADYALDPTDPRFAKAGPAAAVLAKEVAIRRSKAPAKRASNGSKEDKDAGEGANGGAGNSKADLKLMVASLKRKAATAEAGSGKAQGKAQAQGGKPAKMRKGGKGG